MSKESKLSGSIKETLSNAVVSAIDLGYGYDTCLELIKEAHTVESSKVEYAVSRVMSTARHDNNYYKGKYGVIGYKELLLIKKFAVLSCPTLKADLSKYTSEYTDEVLNKLIPGDEDEDIVEQEEASSSKGSLSDMFKTINKSAVEDK